MNFVQSMRDLVKLQKMKQYLKSKKSMHSYILFILEIITNLRISNILKLKKRI